MSSDKKVVLVTGCTKGGIGFALCEEYARHGCKVYATARRLEAMNGFEHPDIETLVLDVTSDENVRDVVKTVMNKEGRIDVLVNNAGSNYAGALFDVPIETVQKAFDTNTFSILRLVHAVLPHMAERNSGTIVNIGSVVGNCPTPWNGIYAATKAAIHNISDVLWMETKPFGVHVILVAPSYVRSNIAATALAAGIPQAEDSPYRSFLPQILNRVGLSQSSRAVTAEEFARQTVPHTLSPNPPRKIITGGWALAFRILEWIPRTWVLSYFWNSLSR